MRTKVLTILMFIMTTCHAFAAPPMTGGSSKSMGDWLAPMNPANWTMPKMPWTSEPARIKKKPGPNPLTKMNESAKQGWTKTKEVLDPTRMFKSKPTAPAQTQPMSNQTESSFFGDMFKTSSDSKDIRTTNDFLKLPRP